MKYGVISDTHDHFYNLERAVELIKEQGITTCFHLGDFCAPGLIRAMVAHRDINWICVWGNVDGAKAKILLEQKSAPKFDISDEHFREVEIDGSKIFLVHFPLLAQHAAQTGNYKAVFYGDNHTKNQEKIGETLLANPGALAGSAKENPSFGIWDSETNEFEIIDLPDFRLAR